MTTAPYSSFAAATLVDLAVEAIRRGDQETALTCLQEAVSREDATGAVHYLLGAQLAQMGRIEQAVHEWERLLEREPGMAIARFQLGLLLMTAGNPAQAETTLQPLLDLGSTDPLANFAAGLLHLARDEFSDAQRCLARGIEYNSSNPPLNADMQKLSARIASIAAPPDGEGAGKEVASHVLLAAYMGKPRG